MRRALAISRLNGFERRRRTSSGNTQRPHEAPCSGNPGVALPSQQYRFPEKIEPFDYGPEAIVRRVDGDGWLSFRNRPIKLGQAFSYRRVALRATAGMAASMYCSAPTRSAPLICARRHRERLILTLAPVGPQAPPAPSARRALDGARERRGALLWITGTSCVGANPSIMSPNTCSPSPRSLQVGAGAD
jgi:hypothetical protein